MQVGADTAKMMLQSSVYGQFGMVDRMEHAVGITPGAEADFLLNGFVGNPNGSDYNLGKMYGNAGILMAMAVDAALPGGILPKLGAISLESKGAEGASLLGSSTGRMQPYLARTAGLGETASLAEIIEGALVPGREGITLTEKTVRFGYLYAITEKTGIEYALTRKQ